MCLWRQTTFAYPMRPSAVEARTRDWARSHSTARSAWPEITTLNVGAFDWDGNGLEHSETNVLAGAVFTINAAIIDDDGAGHNGLIVVADTARVNVNTVAAWPIGDGGILRLGGPTAEVGGSADIDVTVRPDGLKARAGFSSM